MSFLFELKLKPKLTWQNESEILWPGEVVSIALPRTVTAIWPLPYGLLLQLVEGNSPVNVPFSSSPLLSAHNISHRRESVHNPNQNYSSPRVGVHHIKGGAASMSSHMILSDMLEEPQVVLLSILYTILFASLSHVNNSSFIRLSSNPCFYI